MLAGRISLAELFEVVFDGGSKGNPGLGYGSYEVLRNRQAVFDRQEKIAFGDRLTNNQAEYMSLIRALRVILDRSGVAPQDINVQIYGDSMLVIRQIKGEWKVKNANMKPLWDEAQSLLRQFGGWSATWHDRSNSVRLLGH